MKVHTLVFIATLCIYTTSVFGQRDPEFVYMSNIKTVQLNQNGDQLTYPVIRLNSNDVLQLDFDDLDGDIKDYYYNFELRNADWSSVQMSYYDYVKGYSNQRIRTYRRSSQSLTRYTHYQLRFPDRDIVPTKPGNYVLKVFLNADTTQLAFTKRFLVTSSGMFAAAQIQQPFNQQKFRTDQKVMLSINPGRINVSYPQEQIKVVVLQNMRWDNAKANLIPNVIRGTSYEYNAEADLLFPATREWRWLNLTSFRLLSDRIQSHQNTNTGFNLTVVPDGSRNVQRYVYYRDFNGWYNGTTNENINPYENGEYATVRFSYRTPDGRPYPHDLYMIGQITNYGKQEGAKMQWDDENSAYTTSLFIKQGYYDYFYATGKDVNGKLQFDTAETEGNIWETENQYTVLIYYRELGGRFDQLMNITNINSLQNRPGDSINR